MAPTAHSRPSSFSSRPRGRARIHLAGCRPPVTATVERCVRHRPEARDRRLGRPPDLRRGREPRPDLAPRSSTPLPGATLLVVDDSSPDGTGDLADRLAAADPRIRVRHRPAKQGLGRAYLDGFGVALDGGADVVIQMDADWSHDPAALPVLIAPIVDGPRRPRHRLALHAGGGVVDWGIVRRVISRGGSIFARTRPRPRAARPDRRVQGVARRRRSRRCRSTASTPAATCSRSR